MVRRAAPWWMNSRSNFSANAERPAVGRRQPRLADDRGRQPGLATLGVDRVDLVGPLPVVGRGLRADARPHEPGQGGQHVDRRERPLPVEFPAQHDLAFGDVAGEVGNRVGDVVVGHREDRQLRHRPVAPADHAGPLEDRGEVGVHVAGIAPPSGNLLPGGAQLAQRLAVVGDVGQHDEHVHAALERQVLRLRQREPGRQQALDGRVAGAVEVEHAAREGVARLEAPEEVLRLPLGEAERDEDHRERLGARRARVGHHPRRELEAREAGAREDRQLLAAHEGVHPVDGGNAGLDEVRRLAAAHRIERRGPRRPPRRRPPAPGVRRAARRNRRTPARAAPRPPSHGRCRR